MPVSLKELSDFIKRWNETYWLMRPMIVEPNEVNYWKYVFKTLGYYTTDNDVTLNIFIMKLATYLALSSGINGKLNNKNLKEYLTVELDAFTICKGVPKTFSKGAF